MTMIKPTDREATKTKSIWKIAPSSRLKQRMAFGLFVSRTETMTTSENDEANDKSDEEDVVKESPLEIQIKQLQLTIRSLKTQMNKERLILTKYHDDWETAQVIMAEMESHRRQLALQVHDLKMQLELVKKDFNVLASQSSNQLLEKLKSVPELEKATNMAKLNEFIENGSFGTILEPSPPKQIVLKPVDIRMLLKLKDLHSIESGQESSLYHPNLMQAHSVMSSSNHIYLVLQAGSMDLASYCSLQGKLRYSSAQQVARGVLMALDYLHQLNCSHLDLTPENIILVPSHGKSLLDCATIMAYQVQLCDFGFCRYRRDNNYISKDFKGTRGFYAPEIVTAGTFHGPTADMWSFGACLLHVTTGLTKDWFKTYKCKDKDQFQQGLYWVLRDMVMNPLRYFQGSDHFRDLITQRLLVPPEFRFTAGELLEHPWLTHKLTCRCCT